MEDVLYKIAVVAGPVISSGITWIVARKKNGVQLRKLDAEASSIEIKNVHSLIGLWKGIVKDLQTEVDQLRTQVNKLSNIVTELEIENGQLKRDLNELQRMTDKSLK